MKNLDDPRLALLPFTLPLSLGVALVAASAWLVPPKAHAQERDPEGSRLEADLAAEESDAEADREQDRAQQEAEQAEAAEGGELPVGIELSLGTAAPFDVSAELLVELPGRLSVSVQGGFGAPYRDAGIEIASGLAGLDAEDRSTLTELIGDPYTLRINAGWRPMEGSGFELQVGYMLLGSSGSTSATGAVALFTGATYNVSGNLDFHTRLHAFRASLGWRWLIGDHFLIRARLGYVHTLEAEVDLGGSAMANVPASVRSQIRAQMRDAATTYGILPEAQLMVGYRF